MSNSTNVPLSAGDDAMLVAVNTFLRVVLSLTGAVGCFGSVLTITCVATNKNLRTIPNAFLVNLSAADFIVCSFLIPMTMVTYTERIPEVFCRMVGYLNLTFLMVSVLSLGQVAINRYVVICRSRQLYLRIYTKRNTALMILATWILALLLYMPPFFGFGTYTRNQLFGACIFQSADKQTYFFVLIFADILVVGPVLLLTAFSYVKILLKFRASRMKVTAMAGTTTLAQQTTAHVTAEQTTRGDNNAEISAVEDASKLSSNKRDLGPPKRERSESDKKARALIKNLITIFLTFLLCWMPMIVIYKIDYFGSRPEELYHMLFAVAQSNSAANFMIYCSMNTQFRNAYKRLLTGGRYGKDI